MLNGDSKNTKNILNSKFKTLSYKEIHYFAYTDIDLRSLHLLYFLRTYRTADNQQVIIRCVQWAVVPMKPATSLRWQLQAINLSKHFLLLSISMSKFISITRYYVIVASFITVLILHNSVLNRVSEQACNFKEWIVNWSQKKNEAGTFLFIYWKNRSVLCDCKHFAAKKNS